ncbi:MAG: LytR/AlgR family response regulator transcription factor [Anaerocolumna sp.]
MAIYDEDINSLIALKNMILEFDRDFIIEIFSDFVLMKESLYCNENYDLVFMEIELDKEEKGLNNVEKLNVIFPKLKIILMTQGFRIYFEDIFLKNINLYGYLQKPYKREKVFAILAKMHSNITCTKDESIVVKENRNIYTVMHNDIIYIESVGHKINIYTKNKRYVTYGKLSNLLERLKKSINKYDFLFIMEQIVDVLQKIKVASFGLGVSVGAEVDIGGMVDTVCDTAVSAWNELKKGWEVATSGT